jgi:hypothetical protein
MAAVMISAWNTDMGGQFPTTVALYALAGEATGQAPAAEAAPRPAHIAPKVWEAAQAILADPGARRALVAGLRGMYAETQERLQAAGLPDLPLIRGTHGVLPPSAAPQLKSAAEQGGDWARDGRETVTMNGLSSWTLDPHTATDFTQWYGSDAQDIPVAWVSFVPAARVLSFGGCGFGEPNQQEVVVLGGPLAARWLATGEEHANAAGAVQRIQDGGAS